ncbi:MAG: hypothetical protein BWZ01_02118 [Deltaproteobacteria bacterium ADurb.BinA179]|nr:MAG: hypothetical protein BWZ01_02118 [Deltaproteobacteria bacterium ADurb.BinA179]HNR51860.1 hypothetical protein [Deltaproteobacteria bacterium]HOD72909.1 hypothetical protein [Deltaproteobacteria bacterium]HOS28994.1 hypothetical protein [Deltaproteobacteria bacterium]HQM21995.1 hypothetical protein [Deltaproteobacteria bacterium]
MPRTMHLSPYMSVSAATIGWVFAVTPAGPVIIEANQEWGTAGLQAANGGLLTEKNRKLFARYGLKFYG